MADTERITNLKYSSKTILKASLFRKLDGRGRYFFEYSKRLEAQYPVDVIRGALGQTRFRICIGLETLKKEAATIKSYLAVHVLSGSYFLLL